MASGLCLTPEDPNPYAYLSAEDIAWLESTGWTKPHWYVTGCVTAGCCSVCEPCSCDFGLYQ